MVNVLALFAEDLYGSHTRRLISAIILVLSTRVHPEAETQIIWPPNATRGL